MKKTAFLVGSAVAVTLLSAGPASGMVAHSHGLIGAQVVLDLDGSTYTTQEASSYSGEDVVTTTTTFDPAVYVGTSKTASVVCCDGGGGDPVYYRTFTQTMKSALWGVAWSETHKGLFFFNGTTVWLKQRLAVDNFGYHRCGYSSGAGFSVSVQSCWKTGDPSSTGYDMTLGDQFKVSAVYKGSPVSSTHEQRACVYPNGGGQPC
jgi:hypothetical protein